MFDINIPVEVVFLIGLSLTITHFAVTTSQFLHLKTVKQTKEEKSGKLLKS